MMMSMTTSLWTTTARIACVAGAVVALTACSSIKDDLGLTKNAPDEFAVVTKAPLVMPPDYSLRPPQPGAPGAREASASDQARQALLGTSAAPSSPAQNDLLAKAGADKADPDIRAKVAGENRELSNKTQTFSDQLLYGQTAPAAATAAAPAATQQAAVAIDPATGEPVAAAPVAPPAPTAPAIDPITGQPQVPAEAAPAPAETASAPAEPVAPSPQPAKEEDGWFDWF